MEDGMETTYQRTQDKSWKNFKSVISLRELIAGANVLPVIVAP
jgi:hypothetical protein